MSILIDKNTNVLVQGITGTEGGRAARLMLEYGTKVVAGVTPGKGGQEVIITEPKEQQIGKMTSGEAASNSHKEIKIPVYDTVQEALENHPEINTSTVYVPPFAAKDATMEAISNGIKLVNVITEGIPIRDTFEMISFANAHSARIIGPSSVGILSPEKCRLGVIGGEMDMAKLIYKQGEIGIISKSGGMTNETAWVIRQAGLGQSTVIGIGGDIIIGNTFTDLLELFENDNQTKGVVIFGELGGTYEDQVASMIIEGYFTKPIAAFIGGKFAEKMPQGMSFGHAGALIEGRRGLPSEKTKLLKQAGAIVVNNHHELGEAIKEVT